jgi:hypothetical protein
MHAHEKVPHPGTAVHSGCIHPSESAHWIMAAELPSAWHVDPFVNRLAIDARLIHAGDSCRSQVSGLKKTESGIKWTELDEALPISTFPSKLETGPRFPTWQSPQIQIGGP